MKILQNRTVSVISTLFQNVGVGTSLYFNERGAASKRLGTYAIRGRKSRPFEFSTIVDIN